MSRIRVALALSSLATALPAGAMSLEPAAPELAPETLRIRLDLALGEERDRLDPSAPVFELVTRTEPAAPVRVAPRPSELFRAGYDREVRSDLASASRAALSDLVAPALR